MLLLHSKHRHCLYVRVQQREREKASRGCKHVSQNAVLWECATTRWQACALNPVTVPSVEHPSHTLSLTQTHPEKSCEHRCLFSYSRESNIVFPESMWGAWKMWCFSERTVTVCFNAVSCFLIACFCVPPRLCYQPQTNYKEFVCSSKRTEA